MNPQPDGAVSDVATGDKLAVLSGYARGELSRSMAMQLLDLDWYGDLHNALAAAGLERPSLPEAQRATMRAHALAVLAPS